MRKQIKHLELFREILKLNSYLSMLNKAILSSEFKLFPLKTP